MCVVGERENGLKIRRSTFNIHNSITLNCDLPMSDLGLVYKCYGSGC